MFYKIANNKIAIPIPEYIKTEAAHYKEELTTTIYETRLFNGLLQI